MKDSARLRYRKWTESDIDAMVDGLNNENVSKYFDTPYPFKREYAEKMIEDVQSNPRRVAHNYAICLKSNNAVIGGISFSYNLVTKMGVTGKLWINEKYEGQGYGREAMDAKMAYYFDELDFPVIRAAYIENNERSKRMQEALGFRAIETKKIQGKNHVIMGLSKGDWLKQKEDKAGEPSLG